MRKLLIVCCVLLLASLTYAQDTPEFYCGDLSEADCELLQTAYVQQGALTGAVFQVQAGLGLDLGFGDSFDFTVTANGVYTLDPELGEFFLNPEALNEDGANALELFADGIRAINSDVNVIIEIPEDLNMILGIPENRISTNLRLVDGVGYINFDKLTRLDTSGELPSGWYGVDIGGFYDEAIGGLGFEELLTPQTNTATAGLDFTPYTNVTLGDDDGMTMNGQEMRVFTTTYDFSAAFRDPELTDIWVEALRQLAIQNNPAQRYSDRELAEVVEVYARAFEDLEVGFTQVIGTEDNYIHRAEYFLNWTPSPSTLRELGSSFDPLTLGDINFDTSLSLSLDLAQFNNAPTVSAPEDATIIPFEDLVPLSPLQGGDA